MKPAGKTGRISPIILAIAAQFVAALLLIGILQAHAHLTGQDLPILAKLLVQAFAAASLSALFRLPPWWLYIQMILPFAAAACLMLSFPGWIYPLLLLALVTLFWNSADDRVPLYLSNRITTEALLDLLPQDRPGHFIDLGCGPAGMLLTLAAQRPDWRFTGVESAPLLWAAATLRSRMAARRNIQILRENLWKTDCSDAEIIYAFLSPAPMRQLYEKLSGEMKPGSRLVSNSFIVPGHSADEIMRLPDNRKTELHIWHFQ